MKNRFVLRALSLCLALLLLTVCFVACAGEDNPADTTPTPSQSADDPDATPTGDPDATPRITPDIPESADYGDAEVAFLYWTVTAWENTVRYCRDIVCEDYSGDRVSNAVYSRNAYVEENYKVKITVDIQTHDRIQTLTQQMNAVGDETYQVVVPRLLEASKMVTNGEFINLYNVPNVDLTKPWWDKDSIDQLSSVGVLYLVSSSLLVNDKDATAALAFSKDAATDTGLGDIYSYVLNNEWTYETVAEIASSVAKDTDGDDVMTKEDFWGFLGKNDVMTSFFHGSGGLFVTKEDDIFVLDFGEDETDIEASQAILQFVRSSDWFFNHHTAGVDDDTYTKMFENGHGLFFWMRLDEVTNMRNCEIEFGILPIPKYDADQENYHSMVSQHTTGLLSIPKSNDGATLEMTGMILEALSAESHYTLQPAYIEDSLKTRYSRDAESKDMLDIILNSRVFDPGCIFGFGGFADAYQNLAASNSAEVVSFYESYADSTQKAIDRYNNNIEDLASAGN